MLAQHIVCPHGQQNRSRRLSDVETADLLGNISSLQTSNRCAHALAGHMGCETDCMGIP
ncbi:hypothetical protein BTHI11S_04932 [Bosea thiooxidans]